MLSTQHRMGMESPQQEFERARAPTRSGRYRRGRARCGCAPPCPLRLHERRWFKRATQQSCLLWLKVQRQAVHAAAGLRAIKRLAPVGAPASTASQHTCTAPSPSLLPLPPTSLTSAGRWARGRRGRRGPGAPGSGGSGPAGRQAGRGERGSQRSCVCPVEAAGYRWPLAR